MKTRVIPSLMLLFSQFLILTVLFTSCGKKDHIASRFKEIATTQMAGNDPVVVCDITKLNDTIDLPLSFLTEDLRIVRLDNRDEALVGGWVRTTITDNYILISNKEQTPFKLFDIHGKYLTNIGSYGQGPDEYMHTYDEQLDEQHNRIYILPWNAERILVYDLKGNPQPPIPLLNRIPKGQFRVNTSDSLVIVTALPFEGIPSVVWIQNFHGEAKQSVEAGHLQLPRDFSNEVDATRNTSAYDVMLGVIMPPRQDTLYHYNAVQNRLVPRFTTKYPGDELPWHFYMEFPGYYIGCIQSPMKISETAIVGSKPTWYIIDKETLTGNYYRLFNDFLGSVSLDEWPVFKNGYYVMNTEPAPLKVNLEKELLKANLAETTRIRIEETIKTLGENDNNVVLFAPLKQ